MINTFEVVRILQSGEEIPKLSVNSEVVKKFQSGQKCRSDEKIPKWSVYTEVVKHPEEVSNCGSGKSKCQIGKNYVEEISTWRSGEEMSKWSVVAEGVSKSKVGNSE